MKIPNTIFIKHCPNLSPERKIFLSKHLEERVPIKDVRWEEDYNHTHLFVNWINNKLKLPYGLKLTSNIIKTIMSWKTMIEENIESAIFMDDDVVFHKDWVSIFESIPDIDQDCFLNLGISPFYDIQPEHGKVYQLNNNAGCEATWMSLNFVKKIMKNLNIHHAGDIILHGYVHSINKPILCVPICHQTSMVVRTTSLEHESRDTMHWVTYIQKYSEIPKLNFDEIFKDYEILKEKKEKLENKFYEIYRQKLDMKQIEYIERSGEYKVNILNFH